jgi:hypothetical protein
MEMSAHLPPLNVSVHPATAGDIFYEGPALV